MSEYQVKRPHGSQTLALPALAAYRRRLGPCSLRGLRPPGASRAAMRRLASSPMGSLGRGPGLTRAKRSEAPLPNWALPRP